MRLDRRPTEKPAEKESPETPVPSAACGGSRIPRYLISAVCRFPEKPTDNVSMRPAVPKEREGARASAGSLRTAIGVQRPLREPSGPHDECCRIPTSRVAIINIQLHVRCWPLLHPSGQFTHNKRVWRGYYIVSASTLFLSSQQIVHGTVRLFLIGIVVGTGASVTHAHTPKMQLRGKLSGSIQDSAQSGCDRCF